MQKCTLFGCKRTRFCFESGSSCLFFTDFVPFRRVHIHQMQLQICGSRVTYQFRSLGVRTTLASTDQKPRAPVYFSHYQAYDHFVQGGVIGVNVFPFPSLVFWFTALFLFCFSYNSCITFHYSFFPQYSKNIGNSKMNLPAIP